jgi:hypothetical protein
MSQIAFSLVFAIPDSNLAGERSGIREAVITSLLVLGVGETNAAVLFENAVQTANWLTMAQLSCAGVRAIQPAPSIP